MKTQERGEFEVVRRHSERRQIELYALVLTARGVESVVVRDGDVFALCVAREDLDRANEELTAHDLENPGRRSETKRDRPEPPNVEFLLVYWAVLLFFFAAARNDALSAHWLEVGAAEAGPIRNGEWWRTVTALFLHVSGAHLLSNLAFGTVFLLLLSQVLGAGLTALAVVAAGAGGNILNALIRPPLHTSIGASTAVFAAIGLLAALQQRRGRRSDGLHNWAPLAGGVMLLTFLGLSGEQTDVLAHVFGFLAGLGLGSLLAWMDRPWPKDRALQRVCAWTAVATVALAWIWGFLAQP